MEEQLVKIHVSTHDLKAEVIQEILIKIKRVNEAEKNGSDFKEICSKISEELWLHIKTGFTHFNDQLLCSTCFYTVFYLSDDKDLYMKKILTLLKHEIAIRHNAESSKNLPRAISLMYGLFQSNILLDANAQDEDLVNVLKTTFNLLIILAYDYSQYTYITFKIMTTFKKVIRKDMQDIIFNVDNNVILLNVVNHNWENPITGIRNLNRLVFQNVISVLDGDLYECVLQAVNGFYWNKAKFLMWAEVIEQYPSSVMKLISKYDLIKGLLYSLHKPGLVSAGADMYFSILRKLNYDSEWITIFLSGLIEIVNGQSSKPIENFNNYWCLNTLKKFPSLSTNILIELEKLYGSQYTLYSCLCIFQQSNKLGLVEKTFSGTNHTSIEKMVLCGLEHIDAPIRMLSFDILCVIQSKSLPSQEEYDLVIDYLSCNVNSDCSVLRISMMKSLRSFLTVTHSLFVNGSQTNEECNDLLNFCKKIQEFIVQSINFNGNYQRKVATIQIVKSFLDCFKEVPRKKQKQSRKSKLTVMHFLEQNSQSLLKHINFQRELINLLKDPAEDIREHVMDILLLHYFDELYQYHLENLTEEALLCIRSRFFYQIACGQTMFKLLIKILSLKKPDEGKFKSVENVFNFAYDILVSEYNSKFDIVKSIDDGKQIHSYLGILHAIFETCLDTSYKLEISMDNICLLLDILKHISNQFAWEQASATSSDFSKLDDMVQYMIENSDHKCSDDFDHTNISGLHQIVLNCLWLNVKATCDLSSLLMKYFKEDEYTNVSEQCLDMICHVLETSRHKGAIEAAGIALGQAIQQLTLSPEESKMSKLPMSLLNSKLKDLISETSNMNSITRRGAGLSIMIHRIVSSDMRKGKPLFHNFMKILLETCNTVPEICSNDSIGDTSNEKDLPKAIYIHFLTKIVIDSSLGSDIMYYSANLAELAFNNLTSSYWQIRNAALQLYGSLVPKLIGQKKASGTSEEVIATVAIDEFRSHSPKLWDYILNQLQDASTSKDTINSHSNLVPILSVLANIAPRYSLTGDEKSSEVDKVLLCNLLKLLSSRIYVVRRLTAKSLLNVYSYDEVYDVLLNAKCAEENFFHGILVLLNEFAQLYSLKSDIEEKLAELKHKYGEILMDKYHSFLCRERYENIFPNIDSIDIIVKETVSELNTNLRAPGVYLWANRRIQKCLQIASWHTIPEIVLMIKDCSDFEQHCEVLYKRIECEKSIPVEVLFELSNFFYSLGIKNHSLIVWKILYEMSHRTDLMSKNLNTIQLQSYIEKCEYSYKTRYMIPLAANMFESDDTLFCVSKIIYSLCSPDIADVDMRFIAVLANNELANKYNLLSDRTKLNTIKSALMFLQDEEEDVRNLSVHFYKNIVQDTSATHPHMCLKKILTNQFLKMSLENTESGIQNICSDLSDLINRLAVNKEDEYNPFANDSKNIYLEPEVIKWMMKNI